LARFDVAFSPGQFWCVLGRNGAGKTTLIRTLLGLLPPLNGRRTLEHDVRLGYLPQKSMFDDLYPMSAHDVVTMGTERNWSFAKSRAKKARDSSSAALEALKLTRLSSIRYRDLSAGQKQRVLLARLTAGEPDLAFLDEPTTAMDQLAEQQAFQHMTQQCLNRQACLVVVTHDFALARRYADHALFMDDHKHEIVSGPIDAVLDSNAVRQRFNLASRSSGA
jgi:ABC-type Mn2+/Zn2+ transport system ATPase subunit